MTTDRGHAERQLAAERRVLDLLTEDRPLADILGALCVGVEELLPGASCSILLLDPDGRHLRLAAAPTLPPRYNAAIDGVVIGENVGSCGRAAFLNEPVIVESIAASPFWKGFHELALSHGLHACWSMPIRAVDASVLGTFAIYYGTCRSPDVMELGVIERARSLASLAIARKRAAEALEAETQRAKVTLESITDGVITVDGDGQITYLNPVAAELTGRTPEEALGRPLREVFRLGDERQDQAVAVALTGALVAGVATRLETEGLLVRIDGAAFHVASSIAPMRQADGRVRGVVLAFRNVTSERGMEARLHHRATHDPVTELANRVLLIERLDRAIEARGRAGRQGALLLVDLDGFQRINDAHGHAEGDGLLRTMAARLAVLVGEDGTASRPGRDEFMLLLPTVEGREEAERIAARALAAIAEPCSVGGLELVLSASAGIVLFPSSGTRPHELIRRAEVALRSAKRQGGNAACTFEPGLARRSPEGRDLHVRLKSALAAGEFVLHYQPRASLRTGQVTGVEALLRWNTADRGLVLPAEFIPEIEESGLVVPIGEWVLRTACQQARDWSDRGVPALPIAVNVSAVQLAEASFPELVAAVLAEHGVGAESIELEITESAAVVDLQAATSCLGRLAALGLRLAIDDFGQGHSSLGYLKRFPVHVLKIDQGFVKDLATDADDASITRAIIELGRSLRLTVVAEGVETAEQVDFLKAHACDEIQGTFLSPPLPAAEIPPFVAATTLKE